jgi:hypothetical protein
MDTLSNTLNPDTDKPYHPAVLAAMKLACKKMDRYYSLTDFSATYWVAMGLIQFFLSHLCLLMSHPTVLHPGLKLEYFRRHEWEDEWIKQAENMVREEYISTYEDKGMDTTATSANTEASKVLQDFSHYYFVSNVLQCRQTERKGLPNLQISQSTLQPLPE